MIKRIIVDLKINDMLEDVRPNSNWGYAMYGHIMKAISPDFAKWLHEDGLNPINQCIIKSKKGEDCDLHWIINILGREAVLEFGPLIEGTQKYILDKYRVSVTAANINIAETISEEKFLRKYLVEEEAGQKINLEFLAPTSFRSDNQYVIFPTAELLIKSAVQKWNAYSKEAAVEDEEALLQMIGRTKIQQYRLRSTAYYVKRNRIPGFCGNVELYTKGPEPLVRLVGMLIRFLQYSGAGIKTSLGMGGCKVIDYTG